MNKIEAVNLLSFHGNFNQENSFLYNIRVKCKVEEKLFYEIMDCIIKISDNALNNEQIKSIYSIVFWCRSWINTGVLQQKLDILSTKKLMIYIDIIENSLYYLLEGDVEEAFWAYNEFLDGRYQ
ncbi:MAG: hypothetical protein IKK33_14640 [Lachnospiraceae bacterium]|nr:hypothetical protein [Lachnospiraceae bacterium]